MGSKKRLMDFIQSSFDDYKKEFVDFNINSFLDAFCGSGSVAFYFRHKYQIITNDKLAFSKVIMDAYLTNERNPNFYKIFVDDLNNININDFDIWLEQGKIDGWISQNYGGEYNDNSNINEQGVRKIWILSNAKKIEMILAKIEEYQLNRTEKSVILLSLFIAIDKISNTLGHQNGYLKEWSKDSLKPIHLNYPNIEQWVNPTHKSICSNIQDNKLPYADIMYIDPPYGTNNTNLSVSTRYASFYHLWDTLVTSKPFHRPEIFGKAGKPRKNKGFSELLEINKKEIVIPELTKIIKNSKSKYVAMSYSNKGLLTINDIEKVFENSGCLMDSFRIFTSTHTNNNQKKTATKNGEYIDRKNNDVDLIEYLFIAQKSIFDIVNYSNISAVDPESTIHEQRHFIAYYRNDSNASTMDNEKRNVKNFIDLKSGYLLQEFVEKASTKQSIINQAIEACKLNNATLLIAKLDIDYNFLLTLQKSDVLFVVLDMPDANQQTINLIVLLAQQQRKNISQRTKEALSDLKKNGIKLGGFKGKTHIFNQSDIEKAKLTKQENYRIYKNKILPIIKELKDNKFTYEQICLILEERQIKTFKNKDKWSVGAVRNILK